MKIVVKVLHILLGAVVGFITGASIATYVGIFLASLVDVELRGLFAIFVPLATVICGFAGLFAGPAVALNSPKRFYRLCVPFAVLAICQVYFWRWMRTLDSPRDIVIQLYGPVGSEVVGLTRVDGVETQHKWKLPSTLQYKANRVKMACTIIDPKPNEPLKIEVFYQGKSEWTSPIYPPGSEYGAASDLGVTSWGYSDRFGFGSTSVGGGILLKEDVEPLIKEFRRPRMWSFGE